MWGDLDLYRYYSYSLLALFISDVLSESETDNLEKSIAEMTARKEQLLLTTSTAADKVNADDSLSDLSDEDEYLYPGGEKREHLKLIRLKLEKTTSPKIRKLFSNTDKVFSMTRKRGRALIINNKNFDKRPDLCRKGSDVDVENMSAVLKGLKFEVVTHTDLKAETILSTIKDEGNHFKMQLCMTARVDVGDKGIDPASDLGQAQNEDAVVVSSQPARVPGVEDAKSMNRLNYDDLIVVKSSIESFISKRHPVYGSLMIRALVSSLYKHACHHDLLTIFKQVQTKVRKLCVNRDLDSGQLVVAWDTLTHMRKLYLFPGFNGSKREDNSSL
ncbi:hypothetical protein EB796_024372 [Bugula neritina]|uniref:Uncharacterized protein n=1 Tax=Bugula neritina TaxID=10212 RepID=A0A7J7IU23_BUGNE|nr:hypothetical protein EB796_024372 [Bugula neritina]